MPVYLVHGFRWPREGFTGIRVHAIVHNLEDTSVEYVQNENSRNDLLASFRKAFPDIMKELEGPGRKLDFIEQYNPDDLEGPYAVSQPYAFVGDKIVTIAASPGMGLNGPGSAQAAPATTPTKNTAAETTTSPRKTRAATGAMSKSAPFNSPADITALSVNVEEVIADGPGLTNKAWEALADLRDKLAEGEKIGWWVVFNGDPERAYDEDDEYEDEEMDDEMEANEGEYEEENFPQPQRGRQQQNPQQQQRPHTSGGSVGRPQTAPGDGRAEKRPPPPLPSTLPHIASQHQGLTALPIRPNAAEAATGRTEKGKRKDNIPEPTKLKENAKAQGLRKKFFGRRA
ncbi:hypothetical protein PV11_06342 [Exophiala sideris]|uniref:Uncharacterized protein n=1 Tax=Exophiala sideris TaxID=1016849 RepID=A0A0D1YD31_9EURO|nr:hypothetical protein PV11_06342 [Exophiala sideris]